MSEAGCSFMAHYIRNTLPVDKARKNIEKTGLQELQNGPREAATRDEAAEKPYSFDVSSQDDHKRRPLTHSSGTRSADISLHRNSVSDTSLDRHSHRISREFRSPSRSSFFDFDQSESVAKSLFARSGRALKRHGSKLSLSSSMNFDVDAASGQVFWSLSGLGARVQRKPQISAADRREKLKRATSEPFAFRHLTHAHHAQLQGLERVSKNELIGEFSAIRAGQRPSSGLRGIKVQDLSVRTSRSSTLGTEPDSPASAQSSKASSPVSCSSASFQDCATTSRETQPALSGRRAVLPSETEPARTDQDLHGHTSILAGLQHELLDCSVVSNDKDRLHKSPSMDDFNRPTTRTSSLPVSPPRRNVSRNTPEVANTTSSCSSTYLYSTDPRTPPRRKDCPATYCDRSPRQLVSPEQSLVVAAVGCAISTTDDSARHLKSSPLPRVPSNLGDVLEEGEFFPPYDRHENLLHGRSLPSRHVQSLPATRLPLHECSGLDCDSCPAKRHTSPPTGPCPSVSGSGPLLNEHSKPGSEQSRTQTQRMSVGLNSIEVDDWEDVVDYCYEHAAEADSDFDWNQIITTTVDQRLEEPTTSLQDSAFDPFSRRVIVPPKHVVEMGPRPQSARDSQEGYFCPIYTTNTLPELDSSVSSSIDMDWESPSIGDIHSNPLQTPSPTQASKDHAILRPQRVSYSLFPVALTPPHSP